jgi:YHS domain-containing protein
MKHKFVGLLSATFLLIACQNQSENSTSASMPHEMKSGHDKNKFKGVAFASKKDFICGMPITAGISDTAHFQNKIYGFCSAECKAEFVKSPETFVAGN